MNRLILACGVLAMLAACGPSGSSSTSTMGQKAMRFKNYEFHWSENVRMDIPELPENSVIEIHPSYIIVDSKDGWRIIIPMDRIRFINVKSQL